MAACINLRNRFGRRYRIGYDDSYHAERGAGTRGKPLKGPKPIFGGACRDCGAFRPTACNEWRLAAPPSVTGVAGCWTARGGGRRKGEARLQHEHESIDK